MRPIGIPNSLLASERLMLASASRLDENSIFTLTPYGYKIIQLITVVNGQMLRLYRDASLKSLEVFVGGEYFQIAAVGNGTDQKVCIRLLDAVAVCSRKIGGSQSSRKLA